MGMISQETTTLAASARKSGSKGRESGSTPTYIKDAGHVLQRVRVRKVREHCTIPGAGWAPVTATRVSWRRRVIRRMVSDGGKEAPDAAWRLHFIHFTSRTLTLIEDIH